MSCFEELSLVAMFDEICRCSLVLQDSSAETKFLELIGGVRRERGVWATAVDDCQRKHNQLVEANASVTRLQNCVKQAQNMFDHEQKRRKAAEQDLAIMDERFTALRNLILNEPENVASDARQKMLQWSQPLAEPKSSHNRRSSSYRLGTISESVGSLMSFDDLSVDFTEDDLESSRLRSGRHYRQKSRGQKRVSDSCDTEDDDGTGATRAKNRSRTAKRRNRQHSPAAALAATNSLKTDEAAVDNDGALVATTTLVVPVSGPVTASSQIRTRSASRSPQRRRSSASNGGRRHLDRSFSEPPSAQRNPLPAEMPACISGSDGDLLQTPVVSQQHHRMFFTPAAMGNQYTPAPLRHFGSAGRMMAGAGGTGAGSAALAGSVHTFHEKIIIKPEPCHACNKRINFGKMSLRCAQCRAHCHVGCRERVPVPCVPAIALTPTARSGQGRAQLADYVATRGLMVPALLQHCVHEIEQRAMAEVGIYRVPGSERQVQDLKEKFFRGKGVPRLSQLDCHVVCGCIKDFLRSLIEPVVSFSLWHEFMLGAEEEDDSRLYQCIAELAKPNRDTLAFIISHLQRVASVTENCMNKSNIARMFGPTLVGYSSQNLSPQSMVTETSKQHKLMERLLDLPADYWCRIIESSLIEIDQPPGSGTPVTRDNTHSQPIRVGRTQRQRHLSYR